MGLFRRTALLTIGICAVTSLGCMFRVGHSNVILTAMFFVWVLAPFVGMIAMIVKAPRWREPAQAATYAAGILVSIASVYLYGDVAFGPPRPQPASRFVLVPVASWLALLVVAAFDKVLARRDEK